ncbi:MAG: type II toxin-antitoxin system HigB family toxin [bacterium]
MRIISRKALVEFWTVHRDSRAPLSNWYKVVKAATWKTSADVKQTFGTVDQPTVNGKRIAIFNVGGNKYRIVANIHFNLQKVYIRAILTHAEYETGKWRTRI